MWVCDLGLLSLVFLSLVVRLVLGVGMWPSVGLGLVYLSLQGLGDCDLIVLVFNVVI